MSPHLPNMQCGFMASYWSKPYLPTILCCLAIESLETLGGYEDLSEHSTFCPCFCEQADKSLIGAGNNFPLNEKGEGLMLGWPERCCTFHYFS